MASLAVRCRPQTLDEVVGNGPIVRSIEKIIEAKQRPHTFLLTGGSGEGKTTLAKVMARAFGCADANVQEVDAATNSGVDAVRALTQHMNYKSMSKGGIKCVVVDECHALSNSSWQALLKSTEEPPEHFYWFLCTTEEGKVPKTIRTRATHFKVAPLKEDELRKVLLRGCKELGIKSKSLGEGVADVCVESSGGSARQLLTYLEQCHFAQDADEAVALINQVQVNDKNVIDLCRLLAFGKPTWSKVLSILRDLEGTDPESLRLVLVNYCTKVAMDNKTKDGQRMSLLAVVDAFCPGIYNRSEKMAPVMLAIGSLLEGEE